MTSKSEPMKVKFFICDDVRQELQGKVTLNGLYADDVIVYKRNTSMPEDVVDSISKLSFLVNIKGPTGIIDVTGKFFDPKGEMVAVVDYPNPEEVPDNNSFNFIIQAAPFLVPSFGEYKIVVYINGEEREHTFTIDNS